MTAVPSCGTRNIVFSGRIVIADGSRVLTELLKPSHKNSLSRLQLGKNDPDAQWFAEHKDRQTRIRLPAKELYTDKQRATYYIDECEAEFQTLGWHKKDRRRIIVTKVRGGISMNDGRIPLMKIPFLLFADETVEDRDDILIPIINEIMRQKAAEYGMAPSSGLQ